MINTKPRDQQLTDGSVPLITSSQNKNLAPLTLAVAISRLQLEHIKQERFRNCTVFSVGQSAVCFVASPRITSCIFVIFVFFTPSHRIYCYCLLLYSDPEGVLHHLPLHPVPKGVVNDLPLHPERVG